MAEPDLSSLAGEETLKRKREPRESQPSKRSKKRKNAKVRRRNEDDIDEENSLNLALGRMNPDLLADYVAKKTKRFEDKATIVELEDRRVPVRAFTDTTEWEEPRTLEKLPDFLSRFSGGSAVSLREAPHANGSPHTIVVTSAGLRAADLTRSLRTFQTKTSMIAKLFAKHIKLSESVDMLNKTKINIGVGTPARLIDLLQNGALKIDRLERIVVDSSHVDQKRRGILDMRETHKPLIDLLNRDEIKQRYGLETGKIRLLFF